MRKAAIAAACLACFGLGGTALAASDHRLGDGSATNNPDLMGPGYAPAPLAYPDPQPIDLNPCDCDDGAAYVSVTPPREPYDPYLDIDWSLALRGSYNKDNDGERYEALALPSVSLTHQGNRYALTFDGSAEVSQPLNGELRLSAIDLSSRYDYALDRLTALTAGAAFSLSQDRPDFPVPGSYVVSSPVVLNGAIDAGATRTFGQLDVALRGALGRTVYGPTTLSDPLTVDNTDQNYTEASGGLRLGFAATPVLTPFVDGAISHDWFDIPSSTLLVKTDSTTYTGKVGLAAKWNEVFEAEVSVGLALRRFDVAALGEVTATLYDASVTFRPADDWAFTGSFATTVSPPGPDSSGTTRIAYDAAVEARYTVNSWLVLRALANWTSAQLIGSTDTERGYGVGIGADYLLNDHVALTADYGFGHSEVSPDPAVDTHAVTLGVTFKR